MLDNVFQAVGGSWFKCWVWAHECAEAYYPAFLRKVGAGIATGRIRYREDIVDGLEQAPAAFLGLLEGRNFGKVIVRVDA